MLYISFNVNAFLKRSLESLSDESAIHESEPPSLGLGPVFDVKYVQDVARMVALDDTNCIQVKPELFHTKIVATKPSNILKLFTKSQIKRNKVKFR